MIQLCKENFVGLHLALTYMWLQIVHSEDYDLPMYCPCSHPLLLRHMKVMLYNAKPATKRPNIPTAAVPSLRSAAAPDEEAEAAEPVAEPDASNH